jgi:hypothetical protein
MKRETRREALARRNGFVLGLFVGCGFVVVLWITASLGWLTVTATP